MTKRTIIFIAVIVYILFHSLILEPNSLKVTKYNIKNRELTGVRVVFLTDFHFKKRDYKRLNNVVKLTRKQEPDIVLLGGDFARSQDLKNNMDMNVVASKFSLINAPIFSVLGEGDWWADGKSIASSLHKNGITILENSNKRIYVKGRYIDIVGIADLTTRQPDIDKALTRTKNPRIVVTHNPDIYYDILDSVSLIFAGHTHGGQFVIPFTPPLFVQSKFGAEFASGLITNANNTMIISKGIGTTGFPIRLNCAPEIVVVDFIN